MVDARILFVDDEPLICEFYSMMGAVLGPGYEVFTAASGAEGLAFLEETPVDIVVSDLVMPNMNGHEFMTEVARRHPESMRIVLSGYQDQLTVAQCLMFGHRYMSKPCDVKQLASVLNRICDLRKRLGSANIRRVVAGLGALPTPPRIYQRLTEALNSDFTSMQDVSEIVSEDAGLTVKLLQIANSAYFGGGQKIVAVSEAVQLIGVEILRALTLCVHAFKFYEDKALSHFSVTRLWEHSIETAHGAKRLAECECLSRGRCDEAFVSGLLHDIGKMVMAAQARGEYDEVLARSADGLLPTDEIEQELFGVTHAQVGAYLLGLWGLPESVVSAVDRHHNPRSAGEAEFSPLLAVHAAQCLRAGGNRASRLDVELLKELGLEERIPHWEAALRN